MGEERELSGKEKRQKNLIPMIDRPKEERTAIARKGQKASVEARKRKRLMKESLQAILSMNIDVDICEKMDKKTQVIASNLAQQRTENGENFEVQDAVTLAMINQAVMGDTKASQFVRDTVGEAPTQKQEIEHVYSQDELDLIRRVEERETDSNN